MIYTVQSGDSIYSIAREFGVPASRLISDNLLSDPGRLVVGQDIVVLYPLETYTVRGGDTLSLISQRTGVDIGTLYRNNPILNGRPRVYPGQILNISYDTPPFGEIETLGYAYPYIEEDVIRRTLPYLTLLGIFSYGLREDGGLIEPEGGDERLLSLSREYGTIPILVLTSITESGTFSSERVENILGDPELRNTVTANLVSTVMEKGYGGVDLDFEYIPEQYADEYAAFAREVKAALGEAYRVSVSLAPKTSENQPGLLYRGHNYRLLGEAADDVLLMTYEWGYAYGPPLPVAPLPEVREVVEFAITQIAPEKIRLGIPNYGYDWALPYVRGESRAETISNEEALMRARSNGVEILFDEEAQSPYYNYFDRPVTFSDAIEHTVWFQNARGVEAGLNLVREYNLGGIGIWNIMRYFPSLWLLVNQLYRIVK